jgi:hypothetical protein
MNQTLIEKLLKVAKAKHQLNRHESVFDFVSTSIDFIIKASLFE